MAGSFHCSIVTPEAEVFDGEVQYASIPAHDGQIGLAPSRAPLLVKLGHGAMRVDLAGSKEQWFFIGGGFAQMKNNRLSVLTDEAVPADQINGEEAKAALAEAKARVTFSDEEHRKNQIEQDAARVKQTLAKH